jgi:two-component system chemotaxis family response regulator WspR
MTPRAPTAVTVLLVDDQPAAVDAVRRALAAHADIAFHHCGDAAQALATAERVRPTVILQGLADTGTAGLGLVRRYGQHPVTRDVPVVALSTLDEPAAKGETFAAGASDYLVKPPDAIELIARIRHHSSSYLRQRERDEAYGALCESQRQLLEANTELQRPTNVDELTGLSNRRYFIEYIGPQWNLAARERRPLALLMIDLDDFRHYNDTYGSAAGDEVLRNVAASLYRSFQRPTDLAARIGGEEFAVILPATTAEAARILGHRLCHAIAELNIPHRDAQAAGHVTVSVGGAGTIPRQPDGYPPLIDAAEGALHEAKRSGKNRVVVQGHRI